MKAEGGKERAKSGDNCGGRKAGPPESPSGFCPLQKTTPRRGPSECLNGTMIRCLLTSGPVMPPRQGQTPVQGRCPDQLWLADFTYVHTATGMADAAFVVDVFARKIVGWHVPTLMTTNFVLDALNQTICQRRPAMGSLTHHPGRGMQYASIRYTEWLAAAGIDMSVGSVGDGCDNALA